MYEYVGAIHMHSKFSDGSGDAEKIAETANKAKQKTKYLICNLLHQHKPVL